MLNSIREHNPKSIVVFFLLFLSLLFPSKTIAVENFTTTQIINYDLNEAGQAKVTHRVNLKNNLALIFAKEYLLQIPIVINSPITATDLSGNILKSVIKQNGNTAINLQFNQPAVGKDAISDFQISYLFENLVTLKGKTREIELPLAPKSNHTTINLKIPPSYGQLAYSSVNPSSNITFANEHNIQFVFSRAVDKKILLAFGDNQIFNFKLSYFLENSDSKTIVKEIAIPPTTTSQTVIYQNIDPLPLNIFSDSDGNWLARYQLQPRQKLNIKVEGQAKIFGETAKPISIKTENYINSTKYWPSTNPEIIAIANPLKTPKNIYDYVVNSLSYDYNRINNATRRGALSTLSNPENSLCTDFTDLFITLARAKTIPAREIEGFAYSNNPKIKPINTSADILHAWPQYYDELTKSWKSIDPTWEKTTNGIDYFSTLDLNHFTFVIHGISDIYPPPPGSYRNPLNEKSVEVVFASQELPPGNIPLKYADNILTNQNLHAITNLTISNPTTNWQKHLDMLPPKSQTTVTLPNTPFPAIILPDSKSTTLTITADQFSSPQTIIIINRDHYLYLTGAIAIFIILLTSLGIIITKSK